MSRHGPPTLGFCQDQGQGARDGEEDFRRLGGEGKREAAEAVALDEARSALAKSMAAQAKELAARLMESGRRCRAIDALKGYLTRKARETRDVERLLHHTATARDVGLNHRQVAAIRSLSKQPGRILHDRRTPPRPPRHLPNRQNRPAQARGPRPVDDGTHPQARPSAALHASARLGRAAPAPTACLRVGGRSERSLCGRIPPTDPHLSSVGRHRAFRRAIASPPRATTRATRTDQMNNATEQSPGAWPTRAIRAIRASRARARGRGAVVDVFCGAGGLSHGFMLEGFDVRAGIDIDASCRHAYEHNNGARFIEKNIADVHGAEVSVRCSPRGSRAFWWAAHPASRSPPTAASARTTSGGCSASSPAWCAKRSRMCCRWRTCRGLRTSTAASCCAASCGAWKTPAMRCGRGGRLRGLRRAANAPAAGGAGFPGGAHRARPTHPRAKAATELSAMPSPTCRRLPPARARRTTRLHRASRLSAVNLARIQAAKPGQTWHNWDPQLGRQVPPQATAAAGTKASMAA